MQATFGAPFLSTAIHPGEPGGAVCWASSIRLPPPTEATRAYSPFAAAIVVSAPPPPGESEGGSCA